MVGDNPVDARDDVRSAGRTTAVQNSNWHDERRRSNAVIGASNCSSHVRAVTMTVLRPVSITDSREPCGNSTHQFAVGRTHAGVDNVHGYTSTRLGSGVPSVEWQVALINAIETPRKCGHTFGGLTIRRDRIRCRRGVAGASTIRGTDDKGVGSSVGEPSDLASEGTRSDAGATTWRSCCGVGRNCRATITFWRRPIHRGASVTGNGAHVARCIWFRGGCCFGKAPVQHGAARATAVAINGDPICGTDHWCQFDSAPVATTGVVVGNHGGERIDRRPRVHTEQRVEIAALGVDYHGARTSKAE